MHLAAAGMEDRPTHARWGYSRSLGSRRDPRVDGFLSWRRPEGRGHLAGYSADNRHYRRGGSLLDKRCNRPAGTAFTREAALVTSWSF